MFNNFLDFYFSNDDAFSISTAYTTKVAKYSETSTNSSLMYKKEKKCQECRRPFLRNPNETWRKFCTWCWVKIKGVIVECSDCDKRIPVYENQLGQKNYCPECYVKHNGVSGICISCDKTFYYLEKEGEEHMECHECYLKNHGIKRKCLGCKTEIYIKKEDKAWKKRCYDCWLEPGKKASKK